MPIVLYLFLLRTHEKKIKYVYLARRTGPKIKMKIIKNEQDNVDRNEAL